MNQPFNPDPDHPNFAPLACGLSDDAIRKLLALIRLHTQEGILHIESAGENARIRTGFLGDGEAGDGHEFYCVRQGENWAIKEMNRWTA